MLSRVAKWLLLVVVVMSPAVVFAKPMPPGKWWHNPRVTKHISVSEEEKRKLDDLFYQSRKKLIDLKSQVEKERLDLENAMEGVAMNESAVMAQFKKLETARANLAEEHFRFLLQTRKVIGYERFQQLKRLFHQFRRERMRRAWGEKGARK
jgi:Spy/CpxP family protein refolding chaperone